MMRKCDLIRHCEMMMDRYESIPDGLYRYLEHKIFLELLTGSDVNKMFDKNGEYIDNDSFKED